MTKKRPKLRLRKQVIICLPILIICLITTGMLITKKSPTAYAQTPVYTYASLDANDSTFKLSNISYIKDFTEMVEKRQKDNTIIYYAQLFKLDIDETLKIAKKYTKDYKDKNYLQHNVIGPNNVVETVGPLKSFEAGVVYFARDLYRYPARYGTTIEAIRLDETPTLKKANSKGIIYMDNGLTFEQYVGKISNLFDIEPEFVMSIINLESGNKTSHLFKNKNNVGGHRGYAGWMQYTTLEAGVIAHVLSVRSIARKCEVDMKEPTVEEVSAFSSVYVHGGIGNPSESWTNKVLKLREYLIQKDLFTIKE